MKQPVDKFVHSSIKFSFFRQSFSITMLFSTISIELLSYPIVLFSSSNFVVVVFAFEAEDTFSFRRSDAWAQNRLG